MQEIERALGKDKSKIESNAISSSGSLGTYVRSQCRGVEVVSLVKTLVGIKEDGNTAKYYDLLKKNILEDIRNGNDDPNIGLLLVVSGWEFKDILTAAGFHRKN